MSQMDVWHNIVCEWFQGRQCNCQPKDLHVDCRAALKEAERAAPMLDEDKLRAITEWRDMIQAEVDKGRGILADNAYLDHVGYLLKLVQWWLRPRPPVTAMSQMERAREIAGVCAFHAEVRTGCDRCELIARIAAALKEAEAALTNAEIGRQTNYDLFIERQSQRDAAEAQMEREPCTHEEWQREGVMVSREAYEALQERMHQAERTAAELIQENERLTRSRVYSVNGQNVAQLQCEGCEQLTRVREALLVHLPVLEALAGQAITMNLRAMKNVQPGRAAANACHELRALAEPAQHGFGAMGPGIGHTAECGIWPIRNGGACTCGGPSAALAEPAAGASSCACVCHGGEGQPHCEHCVLAAGAPTK